MDINYLIKWIVVLPIRIIRFIANYQFSEEKKYQYLLIFYAEIPVWIFAAAVRFSLLATLLLSIATFVLLYYLYRNWERITFWIKSAEKDVAGGRKRKINDAQEEDYSADVVELRDTMPELFESDKR